MQVEEKKIYTTDEYLEFEVNSDIRHEYINGEIIPMTSGTPEHNEIASILNSNTSKPNPTNGYSLNTMG